MSRVLSLSTVLATCVMISVTVATPPLFAQERVLELYEVGDLIRPLRHFPAPKLGLDQGEVVFEDQDDAISEDPMWTADGLVELIEELLESSDVNAHVQMINGSTLAVMTWPKSQREISQALHGIRSEKAGVYTIQAQVIEVPRSELGRFAITEEKSTATPETKAIHTAIRELTEAGTLQVIHAPRLTVFAKERASIALVEQTAYVSDLELKDDVVDPVVSTVQLGTTLEVLVKETPSPKKRVGALVEWKATRATAPQPFPTVAVGDYGEIQLPEVTSRTRSGRSLLLKSQCLVVANTSDVGDSSPERCELLILQIDGPTKL